MLITSVREPIRPWTSVSTARNGVQRAHQSAALPRLFAEPLELARKSIWRTRRAMTRSTQRR